MPSLGAAAWLGAVAATLTSGSVLLVVLAAALVVAGGAGVAGRRHPGVLQAIGALLLVAVTAGSIAALRAERVAHNPVATLADDGATVTVVGTVASDPHPVSATGHSFPGGAQVVWRLTVRQLTGRGRTIELRAPVLVMGGTDDGAAALGSTVRLRGRLVPADGRDLAALLEPSDGPELVE